MPNEKVTMNDVAEAFKCGDIHHKHMIRLAEQLAAAENVLKRVSTLVEPLIGKYKPNHYEAIAIKEVVTNYLEAR